jgi:hypothetical protein
VQSLLCRRPAELTAILYCLSWDSPQLGGPGPRIYIPQEQGGPFIPPGTGFPFVASYDSQCYGSGILTRLHTGDMCVYCTWVTRFRFPSMGRAVRVDSSYGIPRWRSTNIWQLDLPASSTSHARVWVRFPSWPQRHLLETLFFLYMCRSGVAVDKLSGSDCEGIVPLCYLTAPVLDPVFWVQLSNQGAALAQSV